MSKNEILEEQRKARQNFLELKKMQHGEMEPEAKPSEVALKPTTPKEKWQNYWYHFKWHTIAVVFLAVVITVLTVQCANREKYDFQVVYFSYQSVLDSQLDKVEEYIEKHAADIDGNGEVNVSVVNCSFSEESKDINYRNTVFSKIQAMLVVDDTSIMYIVDDKAEEYLNTAIETGFFANEPVLCGEEFYKQTSIEEFGKLPEGLKAGNRIIEGTLFEKNEDAKAVFAACEKVLEQIKK